MDDGLAQVLSKIKLKLTAGQLVLIAFLLITFVTIGVVSGVRMLNLRRAYS